MLLRGIQALATMNEELGEIHDAALYIEGNVIKVSLMPSISILCHLISFDFSSGWGKAATSHPKCRWPTRFGTVDTSLSCQG